MFFLLFLKRAENETAEMMEDFISSFEGEKTPKGLTFVKGGVQGSKDRESKDRGQLYQPTPRYQQQQNKSRYNREEIRRSPSPNRKKRRAIDELKEELSLYV